MIKLFTGGFGFLLQIVAVVAGVLTFSFFDPFGLLSPKKRTLQDTPVSVKSIKEIGELISAEYYGEVLSSLREVYIEELSFNSDEEFKEDIYELNNSFKESMQEIKDSIKLRGFNKKGKLLKFFEQTYPQISGHYYYQQYLDYLIGKNFLRDKNDKVLSAKNEKNFLKQLYDHPANIPKITVDTGFFTTLESEKKSEFQNNKKEQKKQIVLLGRGWVKAGFNFDQFSERNFRYDTKRNKIYFIGLKPQILNADINPWFIPERNIRGFEIILATKKVKRSPDELLKVKQSCLNKLLKQAMDRDILGLAQQNAQENLRGFFSMMLDKEVGKVIFVNDELDYHLAAIMDDGKIMDEELYVIDTAIMRYPLQNAKDSAKLFNFVDSLRNDPLEILDKNSVPLNAFSSMFYDMVKDELLDSLEYARILQLKAQVMSKNAESTNDFIWYHDLSSSQKDSAKTEDFRQSQPLLSRNIKRIFLKTSESIPEDQLSNKIESLLIK